MSSKYQCWFCGKGIVQSNGVDPCKMDLFSNADKPENEQTHQSMWCHIQCLKDVSKLPSVLRDGFQVDKKSLH